jgi:hypothetical protein
MAYNRNPLLVVEPYEEVSLLQLDLSLNLNSDYPAFVCP